MELVVGASDATMKILLGKLGGLLAQEYALIRGVRGDIQYINDELASMQAFLRDLSASPDGQDNRMKDWMKQIRDLGYDVEDCIDDFAHRVPEDSLRDARCFFLVMRIYEIRTWWPRRGIKKKIVALKIRAQQIAERRNRYGVNNPGNDSSSSSSGVPAAVENIAEHQLASRQLIGTKEPVGMKIDMDKLEEWATSRFYDRAVLSIVGFGGVGKTTIANALYRKLQSKFEYRASVTVSQNYDEDEVLKSILNQVRQQDGDAGQQDTRSGSSENKSLAPKIITTLKQFLPLTRQEDKDGSTGPEQINKKTMNHHQLVQELKKRLASKRYLLLIDDIWSAKTWESIRTFLPDEDKKCSRILVTTRFQAVGETCCPRNGLNFVHTVDILGGNYPQALFNESISEYKHSKGSERVQEEVPEKIWKICGGLPLAIVAMSGLVACNPGKSKDHWMKVYEKLFPEPVASLTLNGVTRILDLCYNDLPAELRTCALYLSIFPRGGKFGRKRLTRRWIAEGFASETQGLTEEEVAETYFNQLVRRKIIRPMEHSSNGKVKTFQVHDMVLEYIVSKSSEENFITVVGGHWLLPVPSNKVRRLSIQSSGSKRGDSTRGINLSQVRSLTVFGSLHQLPFHCFHDGIIQVLDLEGWNGLKEKHLNDICKMLVLKYLGLRRTGIAKLPSKIGKLEYLETLDIRQTKVWELPKTVGRLKRINSILGGDKNTRKGFKLPEQKSKDPMKYKETMKALRILSGIKIVGESTAVASLHQLTGLRKLAIYKLKIVKDGETFKQLRSAIEYLGSCGLQTLAINDEESDFINSLYSMSAPPRYLNVLELSGNKLERLPMWIRNLNTLNKLTLSVTVLRTATFDFLCHLSMLFSLTFSLNGAMNQDQKQIEEILKKNKLELDGEIFIPGQGFQSLKLLRFIAPLVPKLSFSEYAMPALERIETRCQTFEGLFGIDTLKSLQEVHLRVGDQADKVTKFLVDYLRDNTKGAKVIVDHSTAA
uniref:Uncharacterized protein n=1 Tax=Avena sativa TaxID=4498 RepID=A0ACD5TX69_AVESA